MNSRPSRQKPLPAGKPLLRRSPGEITAIAGAMLAGRLIVPSALAAKSKKKDSEKAGRNNPTGRSDAGARRTRSFAFDLRGWHAEIRIKRGFLSGNHNRFCGNRPRLHPKLSREVRRRSRVSAFQKSREDGAAGRYPARAASSRTPSHAIDFAIRARQSKGRGRSASAADILSNRLSQCIGRMPHERTPICFRC